RCYRQSHDQPSAHEASSARTLRQGSTVTTSVKGTSTQPSRSAECAVSGSDGEELPGSVDAFEFVAASVLEIEACSGDEHWHCGRDPEFTGCCRVKDTSGDVHCDPGDVGASDLDLAGVQSCADLQAERSQGVA